MQWQRERARHARKSAMALQFDSPHLPDEMTGNKKPIRPAHQLFAGASLIVLWVISGLCLALGIAVFVVPATWMSLATESGSADLSNKTCPAITPARSPHTPITVAAARQPFVAAWNSYKAHVLARPEGVRPGCEPLRFPATAAYRGVAVVHHGFSSCPQEMANLGPPLAAKGYDAVFPLLPGHGNEVRYEADAPMFLWTFLGIAFSLAGLLTMCCARILPCAGCCKCACCVDGKAHIERAPGRGTREACCGHRARTRCIYVSAALLGVLLLVSTAGYILVLASAADFCLSLSFVDGVGPGCDGMSEYNDNLPSSPRGYADFLDAFNRDVAAKATGELVLAGLSGGGTASLYSLRATRPDGTALFTRTLLLAPYIDVATIGPMLQPAIDLGLGELKVDFGADCRVARRDAGKAGYCNYRLNRIDAMRDLATVARNGLVLPSGSSVATVKVRNDATVTNTDITALSQQLEGLAAGDPSTGSALCVATHVDDRHSPVSVWNYIHQDVELEWIPELICQCANFLADGTPLPTDGSGSFDGATEPICHTDCDLGGCAYDCVADAFFTCAAGGSGRLRRRV